MPMFVNDAVFLFVNFGGFIRVFNDKVDFVNDTESIFLLHNMTKLCIFLYVTQNVVFVWQKVRFSFVNVTEFARKASSFHRADRFSFVNDTVSYS